MRRTIIFTIALASLLIFANHSFAAGSVRISPAVIDVKGQIRDTLQQQIVIENSSDRRVTLYPIVQNISIRNGRQEFADPSTADLRRSLANWIMMPRAVIQLDAGEKKTINFPIQVELNAVTGTYHAMISFPDAPDRPTAEARVEGAEHVLVNAEIYEVKKTGLNLNSFKPDKRIFPIMPAGFSFELKNNGTQKEVPGGNIFIYDRNGKEVGALSVNKEDQEILPSETKEFRNSWQGSGLGQYKALLSVSYGPDNLARVQDTVYFWVMPWQKIVLLIFILSLVFFVLLYWTNRKYETLSSRGVISNTVSINGKQVGGLTSRGIPHVVDLRHPAEPDKPPLPPSKQQPKK